MIRRLTTALMLAIGTGIVCGASFQPHPAMSALGDTSWVKLQNAYNCGSTLCGNILDYSGMTYDFHRHKILMFGGGHATLLQNDVQEFNFDSLRWRGLYPRNTCAEIVDTANAYLGEPGFAAGGNDFGGFKIPISRHTYDLLEMLPDTNLMIMYFPYGGPGATGGAGCGSYMRAESLTWSAIEHLHDPYVWVFDPVRVLWTRLKPQILGFSGGASSAVDPATGLLYVQAGTADGLRTYDWKTGALTVKSTPNLTWNQDYSMDYNPTSRSFFFFGKSNVFEYTPGQNAWIGKNPSGHFDTKERKTVYDTRNNVFGTFLNGRFCYYSPTTNAWYSLPYDTLRYPANMTYHHLIYDPVDNTYVGLTRAGFDGWNTWAFKFSDVPGRFPGTSVSSSSDPWPGTAGASRCAVSVTPQPARKGVHFDIRFPALEKGAVPSIKLYTLQGRLIKTITPGSQGEGRWAAFWNGTDGTGMALPAGVYLAHTAASDQRVTSNKILLSR